MKIVLIGDSIRMGYEQRVREMVGGRAEVRAPQANCGNSMLVREHLDEWVLAETPDVVHFNCGIHDLGWMAGERVPRFTVSAYVRNLRIIVDRMRAGTGARLIFATTTPFLVPCDASLPNERCKVAAIVERYNSAAVRLMAERDVEIDDLHSVIIDADPWQCLSADKIHMTPRGNEVLAAAVVQSVMR